MGWGPTSNQLGRGPGVDYLREGLAVSVSAQMSRDLVKFNFRQGYCKFSAPFTKPALRPLSATEASEGFIVALLDTFAQYGLEVGQLRYDHADGSFARAHLSCPLLRIFANLRIRVDGIELESFALDRIHWIKILDATLTAMTLTERTLGIAFQSVGVDLGLHAELEGVTTTDFIRRFVTELPTSEDAPFGVAASFYYGETKYKLDSMIGLDLSAAITGALFLRLTTKWRLPDPVERLHEMIGEDHIRTLENLGVEIPR